MEMKLQEGGKVLETQKHHTIPRYGYYNIQVF